MLGEGTGHFRGSLRSPGIRRETTCGGRGYEVMPGQYIAASGIASPAAGVKVKTGGREKSFRVRGEPACTIRRGADLFYGYQYFRSLHHRHRPLELAHGGADAGCPPLRRDLVKAGVPPSDGPGSCGDLWVPP